MSWSRRAFLSLSAAVVLATAGCGFTPLYGTATTGGTPEVTRELSRVRVGSIQDRSGQLLRNALVTRLTPKGESDKPLYELTVTLTVTEAHVALQRDASASRAMVTYATSYHLIQNGVAVATGSVTRYSSYDYLLEHYSDITAGQDVQARLAQTVADEIRNELAAYFIRKHQAIYQTGQATP